MIKRFTNKYVQILLLTVLATLGTGPGAIAQNRTSPPNQSPSVKGIVKDGAGEPLFGATISAKNKATSYSTSVASDRNGLFVFSRLPSGTYQFTISYLGFQPKTLSGEVKTGGTFSVSVTLSSTGIALEKEIVITGTGITRNKSSFTGATSTFTGEQLRTVGNGNVIQSLRALDPSFIVIQNNSAGSNPNVLPTLEIRGKSGVPTTTLADQFASDPNQPLFILDGFETTLQTIVDLDQNRVGSITILKDAASTALYGARASNGVVVIETIRPKAGKLRFSYNNDFAATFPDLSGYNMMNAAEKLQFEKLSGRYSYFSTSVPEAQLVLDQLFNTHLTAVQQGVDTYWLNEPVQTGTSTNNSIFAQGGDTSFTYGVGLNYNKLNGVMKGSGRNTWSGNINLTYRKGRVNINNVLYVRGYKSTESPYGSFSNFVNANPYFRKDPSQKYLETSNTAQYVSINVANPLYDASLPSVNSGNQLEVQNNLQINYNISNDLQVRGGVQLIKGELSAVTFKSPESSAFDSVATLRKGRYTNTQTTNFSYSANMLLNYGKVFAQKHSFTANARAEINNRDFQLTGFAAEGFPSGSTGNPRFAYGYLDNSSPTAASSVYRTLNGLLSVNYAYDRRYLFDASYRVDGSTSFGSAQQFSPYYSSGIGWNANNEAFLKKARWVDRLKLYANVGMTGNQNYGSVSSTSVYGYNSSTNYNQFGQGVSLNTLGNPDLKAQKTVQFSAGMEFAMFNSRLTGSLSAYNKYTDPLVVTANLPSSTGVTGYPLNTGNLTTKGVEVKLGFSPIYNLERRIIWTVSAFGSSYKSRYQGFGSTLQALNREQENNRSLLRYTDGYSPDDIWAAKSLGIDPATGKEIFLTRDGQHTFDYSLGNVQKVGNTDPTVQGIISSSFTYKGFTLNIFLNYSLGGDIFNTALYNKVENISYTSITLNQDRRALYDRWQKPGDIAQFKAISQTSTTPMSSRFVQQENFLSFESLNLGYKFDNRAFLQKLGMQSLSLTAYTNDLIYLSSVRRERGIDYPYAKSVSFSLRASF